MRRKRGHMWRKHSHVLLIVPLVVIVMTWPTLPELFNGDEYWLHTAGSDPVTRIWDAWHIGKVLSGQAELWYTYDMFHPRGASLVFQHYSLPHVLLQLALTQVMPTDSAYNLLFMLILCFNGYSAYVLIQHLLKDKWAACLWRRRRHRGHLLRQRTVSPRSFLYRHDPLDALLSSSEPV